MVTHLKSAEFWMLGKQTHNLEVPGSSPEWPTNTETEWFPCFLYAELSTPPCKRYVSIIATKNFYLCGKQQFVTLFLLFLYPEFEL